MSWGFENDPEYQKTLDWVQEFVDNEVAPLDFIVHPYDMKDPLRNALIKPLQEQVKAKGMWATHLGKELGGQGYGQVQLALLNEIVGGTAAGPIVFGAQAPDSGNSEILAHFGTPELKERYLEPLINNEIVSCYAMTEPQGGSNPLEFKTTARKDGDEWVISGEKWFGSNAVNASFFIIMVVTDPDADHHNKLSMFVVPADTPGIEIVRDVATWGHDSTQGGHAYTRWNDVRIPADHILGEVGQGFHVAQTRLGGGRIHHAMRTVGIMKKALDMMASRAVSRQTRGKLLGQNQMVQEMLADSWIDLEQFRLLVLRTAWRIDKYKDYRKVVQDIAAVKAAMPGAYQRVIQRAIQLHGSLGASQELPLGRWLQDAATMGLVDGATELHKMSVSRELLKNYAPDPELFPHYHLPKLREAAQQKYAKEIAEFRGESEH